VDGDKPVGVLALQGDFLDHLAAFSAAGVEAVLFKDPDELPSLSGVVIPGGESTTIGMLMERRGLADPLRDAARAGLPILGTCAGAILLAEEIEAETVFSDGKAQTKLGLLPMRVLRNGYGRQVDSFEARIEARDEELGFADDVEGIFIRAPLITSIGQGVKVIATFNGMPVMVRKGGIVALTFHPELTRDAGIHAYFARAIRALRAGRAESPGRSEV